VPSELDFQIAVSKRPKVVENKRTTQMTKL